jgi:G3E family GTPase
MNSNNHQTRAVPTNVITGFLGVGKTSAILHLLSQKPAHERWAVLVNEFGEIGVDGSLFEGRHAQEQGIFIREVPGGCMCCASGLPMEIALNQLLAKAKPDRLLVEPTGLGHPKEVLQVLSAEHYQKILSLQKTLTLVDARKLSDQRYISHETFNQQIAIADTIIGNKLDLYDDGDRTRLVNYAKHQGQTHVNVIFAKHGKIELLTLQESIASLPSQSNDHHDHHVKPFAADSTIPECGYIKAVNEGDGFYSVGWRFSPDKVFNREKLFLLLTGVLAERIKAVFITNIGVFGYNATSDALNEFVLDDCFESRIEIISESIDDSLEIQLLECIEL